MIFFPGKFFLLVGPSGVGKGTVIQGLKNVFSSRNDVFFPITATTRDPRPMEKDGVDYLFFTPEVFLAKLEKNEFLEYAIVHQKHYYGLPKDQVFTALTAGKKVIRELDIQGLWNIQKVLPAENIVSIFLYPESLEILKKRISSRSPVSEEELERRLQTARNEIRQKEECTYQVCSREGQKEFVIAEVQKIIEDHF